MHFFSACVDQYYSPMLNGSMSGLKAAKAMIGFPAWWKNMQLHGEETINNIEWC